MQATTTRVYPWKSIYMYHFMHEVYASLRPAECCTVTSEIAFRKSWLHISIPPLLNTYYIWAGECQACVKLLKRVRRIADPGLPKASSA
jgi:hypothetical protein